MVSRKPIKVDKVGKVDICGNIAIITPVYC